MKRIVVLACAGLALAMSSPLGAEQAAPPAAQADRLPPAPPMPPTPNARHRWVDIDGASSSRSSHKATTRHAAAAKPHVKSKTSKSGKQAKATKTAKASKHVKAGKSAKTTKHIKAKTERNENAMHFSAKTVRSCHAMTYRQIMRSSSCRAMMSQELSASPPSRHAPHAKAAAKKKAAVKTARHKTAAKATRHKSSAKRSKR